MQKLKDKVALVTGGSRGMGAAIVKQLAHEGANVAFTYVNGKDKADGLVKDLADVGLLATAIQADNAIEGRLTAAAEQVLAKFGRLDILVNNAGVYAGKPIQEHTLDDYRFVMDINVKAVFEAVIFAAKHMADFGRIITIGSNMAERIIFAEGTLYGMSKSALVGLTKGLARDLGPKGITVNLIQPGPVDTDMNPDNTSNAESSKAFMAIRRYGQPTQIAELVSYLASPSSGYTTGSVITIDGGFNC